MITWIKCHHVKNTEVHYWCLDIMRLNYFYPRELEIIYKSLEETTLLQAEADLISEQMYTLLYFHVSVCGGWESVHEETACLWSLGRAVGIWPHPCSKRIFPWEMVLVWWTIAGVQALRLLNVGAGY